MRAVTSAFEARFGLKVQVTDKYCPWLVRHSSWLMSELLAKTDGKTPYQRLCGREYKGQVVEPFEVCRYKLEGVGKM